MANPKLNEGDSVPSFSAESNEGVVTAKSLKGSKYILYFYPKDDTPGCTKEACDFRDNIGQLESQGFKVFGISPDSSASHDKFRAKYELPFTLLSDADHTVAEAFAVWREKKNYGRTYTGLVRSTFVVDEDGKLLKVYDNVRATGHVARLLKELS
ncbi:MAG: thioredoxin-dependent thiol peroxidase [Myxococcales bacterium]|nr:thioredoxin-dependent thiol peroxidase [Myxococcales bacterium]